MSSIRWASIRCCLNLQRNSCINCHTQFDLLSTLNVPFIRENEEKVVGAELGRSSQKVPFIRKNVLLNWVWSTSKKTWMKLGANSIACTLPVDRQTTGNLPVRCMSTGKLQAIRLYFACRRANYRQTPGSGFCRGCCIVFRRQRFVCGEHWLQLETQCDTMRSSTHIAGIPGCSLGFEPFDQVISYYDVRFAVWFPADCPTLLPRMLVVARIDLQPIAFSDSVLIGVGSLQESTNGEGHCYERQQSHEEGLVCAFAWSFPTLSYARVQRRSLRISEWPFVHAGVEVASTLRVHEHLMLLRASYWRRDSSLPDQDA